MLFPNTDVWFITRLFSTEQPLTISWSLLQFSTTSLAVSIDWLQSLHSAHMSVILDSKIVKMVPEMGGSNYRRNRLFEVTSTPLEQPAGKVSAWLRQHLASHAIAGGVALWTECWSVCCLAVSLLMLCDSAVLVQGMACSHLFCPARLHTRCHQRLGARIRKRGDIRLPGVPAQWVFRTPGMGEASTRYSFC